MDDIIVDNINFIADDRHHFDRVLSLALNIGTGLLSSGASVSRVECAIERICMAYGATEVNVFALPSMVECSIRLADGGEASQLKRNFSVSNDMKKMEMFNQLSRDICQLKLPVSEAEERFKSILTSHCRNVPVMVAGGGVAAGAYAVFFGGALIDALPATLIGLLMAYLNVLLSRRDFNGYARTFMLSLIGGILSVLLSRLLILLGATCNVSMVMIGTIMVVVPGLLVCNAIRDLFAGDLYSGAFELMNGALIILAIVAGYGASLFMLRDVVVYMETPVRHGWEFYVYTLITCIIGSGGFSLMFNCSVKKLAVAMGNIVATYVLYLVMRSFVNDEFINVLVATLFAATTAEILARIFKAPSTIFLVPAIMVFVPGGSLYYAMNALVAGNSVLASYYAKIAGVVLLGLAVGISVITAVFQLIYPLKGRAFFKRLSKKHNKK
ncbi:MAG: threonine/serine exporter ThrE family protein [Candidatus Coproplasma sp.]